jgi:CRP/FNR family transcriptional regulator
LEQRILEIACNELVLAQEQMLLLGRKRADERIASFLIARAGKIGNGRQHRRSMEPVSVSLPMTRADIGEYLGITIETVSRTLTRLKAGGLIRSISAAGIVILDFAALQALAAATRVDVLGEPGQLSGVRPEHRDRASSAATCPRRRSVENGLARLLTPAA